MARPDEITDDELIGYLDGYLADEDARRIATAIDADDDLAARAAALSPDMAALKEEFDALLHLAPRSLPVAEAISAPTVVPANAGTGRMTVPWWPTAMAATLALAIGLAAGFSLSPKPPQQDWMQAVADYQRLYGPETLGGPALTEQQRRDGLARAAGAVDLPLTPNSVAIAGLDFQRAQILTIDGAPLVQIAYTDPDGAPVALCLTRTGGPEIAPRSTRYGAMNAVTWQTAGVGFILIGTSASALLQAGQADVAPRISS